MLAAHITFGCHGFWLPNDPRGSWSIYVGSRKLYEYAGAATKVDTSRSLARDFHDVKHRLNAKKQLEVPPVVLNGLQARATARGFHVAVDESHYGVFACVVMPNHVHLVVERHQKPFTDIVGHLKSRASKQMNHENLRPLDGVHSPWARGHWEVWLDSDDDVRRAIEYVEQNPIRDGLKPQHWPFVVPYSR